MTSVSARVAEGYAEAPHATVMVYAGPDPEHRAHVGSLVALQDEASELVRRLTDPAPIGITAAVTPETADGPWCDVDVFAHGHVVGRVHLSAADARAFLERLAGVS